MTLRAVRCFLSQSYENKRLLTYDTGNVGLEWNFHPLMDHFRYRPVGTKSGSEAIGEIRNWANEDAATEIIVHWDSDDWSHPNRIAEQVTFLQTSGAEAVAYDSMLFWDSRKYVRATESQDRHGFDSAREGLTNEAWLYCGYPLGTSLCYWRKTWERVQFPDTSYGEDSEWLKLVKWKAQPSIVGDTQTTSHPEDCGCGLCAPGKRTVLSGPWPTPRMIASIHGGNTSKAYDPQQMAAHPKSWRRVPEWDRFCERTMKL